jgi:peptidoglycan/LPS O-acetylase OafA/YrhL
VGTGEASYALYLIHMPLSWYLTKALQMMGWPRIEAWTGLTAFVLFAVLFAFAIFNAIEQPARERLKARYRDRYPWGRFKLFSVLNPSG